ncbi:exonuclease [Sulfurimonas gotlandica GD1]|uniref:Exonuclease n=1 Tax=Sulfurimonas gotlandica (strain DSM 19862 / JCM 16533 / GD1) TaxID=929558 RepID=B6BIU0_SULGG|nr:exonuclease domain-containing protein [Sulfurimonas gotlandica]EDZ63717.1 exonuclease [Sulfurimonas gotlandica GD1]EHP30450.1 exonuclease [Sulfurimonas gotlandica GD1]
MLIFLDVETTGLEEIDRVCSIGIVWSEDGENRTIYELVNEGKKIPSLASSINHITNEMLKGKPKFQESEAYKLLTQHNNEDTTIVGHNIKFDLAMLKKSGFNFIGEIIDTLRVTKHLVSECEQFSLQFLRYELKLYKEEKELLQAHHALSDATIAKNLYEYLLEIQPKEKLAKLSFENVLLSKFGFGKYNGRYIEEICMCDRGYLDWMLANILDLDEDLRYSIEYYLREVS